MGYDLRCLGAATICCLVLAGCGSDTGALATPTGPPSTPQPTPQPPVNFVIAGVVTELVAGQTVPLEGAHVEDSERHYAVKTGADGSYRIPDVALSYAGGGYIYFAKEGYRSQVRIVPLVGTDARVDVTLVRQP